MAVYPHLPLAVQGPAHGIAADLGRAREQKCTLLILVTIWQLCRLKRSVTPAIIFRELSEKPWVHRRYNQVIGFMHRLSNMPDDSIHAGILRDNIADALEHPACGNWAGGIVKQYSRLGMASPFSPSGITDLNSFGFQANIEGQLKKVRGAACVPKNSSLQEGQALHRLCTVSVPQSMKIYAVHRASNVHFQAAAADAVLHGVSCFAGGTG